MKMVSEMELRAVEGGAKYSCRYCGGSWSGATLIAYAKWKAHWKYSSICLKGYKQVYGYYPKWVGATYLEKLGLK